MRLAIFASGDGSNFQALADACSSGDLPAHIALCVSNNSRARALERARSLNIPTAVLSPTEFADEDDYSEQLLDELYAKEVDFVALAGYLKKIPRRVVHAYRGRMVNIHPALLPAFGGEGLYGIRVHRAVLNYGARWTGATVHLVDDEYDTGPIVLQMPAPVYPDDTPERLAERVLEIEHRIYPQALRLFAQRRVQVEDRRVHILTAATAAA